MEKKTEEKKVYTAQDCEPAQNEICLNGKVAVVHENLFSDSSSQLYFCIGDDADALSFSETIQGVNLENGEAACFRRKDVIGILKPEHLPEQAKLHLSQIRPYEAAFLNGNMPMYSGYCFLEDGRYAAGVWLCSEQEAFAYVKMQKPYQHRVMLCDRDDFCVLEVIQGQVVCPEPKESLAGMVNT